MRNSFNAAPLLSRLCVFPIAMAVANSESRYELSAGFGIGNPKEKDAVVNKHHYIHSVTFDHQFSVE